MFRSIVPLALLIAFASGAGFPPWIKTCKRGPTFNDCALKNGRQAIPFLLKGDPKYKFPAMDPLTISELKITENSAKSIAMNITLKNAKFYGLKTINFAKANFDFNKRRIEWFFDNMDIVILSDYTINGKFLVLPITGSGPANITLKDVTLASVIDYKVEKRKGVDYGVVTKLDLKHTTSRIYIKLENLFNGDKQLGKNMNGFLNENWQEVNTSIGPSVIKGISLYLKQIVDLVLKTVPMKDIFP